MHQYLFHIGDFPIRMYGLVLCMSIFLATGVAYFLAKQDGRWPEYQTPALLIFPKYPLLNPPYFFIQVSTCQISGYSPAGLKIKTPFWVALT